MSLMSIRNEPFTDNPQAQSFVVTLQMPFNPSRKSKKEQTKQAVLTPLELSNRTTNGKVTSWKSRYRLRQAND